MHWGVFKCQLCLLLEQDWATRDTYTSRELFITKYRKGKYFIFAVQVRSALILFIEKMCPGFCMKIETFPSMSNPRRTAKVEG